ncbi:MAG: hypothetical protein MJ068_02450 [Clostridia bacterium]|nr:hypothetical protein [Clostridia bacterium]
MVKIIDRTTEYDNYVKAAANLLKYRKLIAILPTICLIVLSIVICVLAKSAYPLIIAAVALIYCGIINYILASRFIALNQKILQEYVNYYGYIGKNSCHACIKDDNKMLYTKININGLNGLVCWVENNELHYISNELLKLSEIGFKGISYNEYLKKIDNDFGALIISIDSVDHYRDSVLVCKFSDSVLKMTFTDEKALDLFIPKKEFYFNSEKKD